MIVMNDVTNFNITKAAEKQILNELDKYFVKNGIHPFLRINIIKKGCSGLSYNIEFTNTNDHSDALITYENFSLLIELSAIMWTINTTLDYITEECEEKFIFFNHMQKKLCHCKQAFYPNK